MHSKDLSATAAKLKGSFYADNRVTSVNNMNDLETFIEGSTFVVATVQTKIIGWVHGPVCVEEKPCFLLST